MKKQDILSPRFKNAVISLMAVMVVIVFIAQSVFAVEPVVLAPEDFTQIAREGFGDQQNNAAWSMKWWKGELYVGTVRSWFCWSLAAVQAEFPFIPYPPRDPDMDCTESPFDLPLQAEIWRYTPETETWQRVFQSPEDIPIPKDQTKLVARDVGFRGMEIVIEPDGTEALYVLGANARRWTMTEEEEVPCPRILRTTDGLNFDALPPDPSSPPCVQGYDGVVASYRSSATYDGRLFITAGSLQGSGVLLETDDPSLGKENFEFVAMPEGNLAWDMTSFNGYLYVGTQNEDGYCVYKTTAVGEQPYEFFPVVTQGGYRPKRPSKSIVSMCVFNNRLYVGTDTPAELIRINPDDTWDLIVGEARATPDGWKAPLSGFDHGFDWPLNVHIWRMQEHDGVLYAGTADQSTRLRKIPIIGKLLEKKYGFDLYGSSDGVHWTPITTNGFEDKFQMGLRTFTSTPYGLFFGTCNFWGGLQVWKGERETAFAGNQVTRLEAEEKDGAVVLSWDGKQNCTKFHVFRSTLIPISKELKKNIDSELTRYDLASIDGEICAPGDFIEISNTDQLFYEDTNAVNGQIYHYHVIAEDVAGQVSAPSNFVRVPSLAPKVTLDHLQKAVYNLIREGKVMPSALKKDFSRSLLRLERALERNRLNTAMGILDHTRIRLTRDKQLDPWHIEDLNMLLTRFMRRVHLAKIGVLAVQELF